MAAERLYAHQIPDDPKVRSWGHGEGRLCVDCGGGVPKITDDKGRTVPARSSEGGTR